MDEAHPGKVPPRGHYRKAEAAEPPKSFVRKQVIQPKGGSKAGSASPLRKAHRVVRKGQSLADIDVNEVHREAIAWAKRHPKSFEALGRT